MDWRALACPPAAEEWFEPVPGDPADAALLGRLAQSRGGGVYPALTAGDLMILPGVPFLRSRMRALQSQVTDPVSFALRRGEAVATFSGVPGFTAAEVAGRAVAEQAAWLTVPATDANALGALFCAARAALFADSLEAGEPVLTLTVADTARRLAECSDGAQAIAEEAAGAFAERAGVRAPATVEALRGLVAGLPAFTGSPSLTCSPAR